MRTDTGLHADQARWYIGQPRLDLTSRLLLTQHDNAVHILADDVERVLVDINADDGDRTEILGHGVLLVWVPLASIRLAR